MSKKVINLEPKERKESLFTHYFRKVMKFSRLLFACGMIGLFSVSCTTHSSCPAYGADTPQLNFDQPDDNGMVIEERNV